MTITVKAYEQTAGVSVFPDHIQENAKTLIGFIVEYYKHLNTVGMPSYELSNLTSNHDIDQASDFHLSRIQGMIAKTVPSSNILDKRRLLKIIVNYYNTRGSEDSIYTFFKIFFNELVTVIYPREFIFNTSGTQSVTSDQYRLHDGEYWQSFSYVVRSNLPSSEWRDEFIRFVHPSGLKLFAALILQFHALMPETIFNDESNQDLLWNNIDWDASYGLHSPREQAGWERDMNFEFIYRALIDDSGLSSLSKNRIKYGTLNQSFSVDPNDLFNFTRYYLIQCLTKPSNDSLHIFHSEYSTWLKFLDPTRVSDGYLGYSTNDSLSYQDNSLNSFKGIGSFIDIDEGIWVMSNYDSTTDTEEDWEISETDSSESDLPYITSSI